MKEGPRRTAGGREGRGKEGVNGLREGGWREEDEGDGTEGWRKKDGGVNEGRKVGEGKERRRMSWPQDQGFTLRIEKQEPKGMTYHLNSP